MITKPHRLAFDAKWSARLRRLALCGALAGPVVLAAPASAFAAGSGGGLGSVASGIGKSETLTFSVTYHIITNAGKAQDITFAQEPPKQAIITSAASFYISPSQVLLCSKGSCYKLPSSMSSELTGLQDLFAPQIIEGQLKALEAVAASKGYHIKVSSATYGGLASTCVTVSGPKLPSGATYCASDKVGLLTRANASGSSLTLTSYSGNPPASTFSPPPGDTVVTLPSGV